MCVPRLAGHTFVDNQAYKSKEVLEDESRRDPMIHLKDYLSELAVMNPKNWPELEVEVEDELSNALQMAEAYPEPEPAEAGKFIFFEGKAPLQGGLRPEGAMISKSSEVPIARGHVLT
jgi:TPP-dependent pyruvate/acetoin dehydrogenase alpha subunit